MSRAAGILERPWVRVVGIVALAHVVHLALRSTAEAILTAQPFGLIAGPVIATAASVLGLSLLVAFDRRRGSRGGRLVITGLLLTFGLRYAAELARQPGDGEPTPAVAAMTPGDGHVENHPLRPRIAYRINEHHFRGPEWSASGAGSPRVCILGDSYVFGSGVPWGDTIGETLERAFDRRGITAEAINLGVPGHGFASHREIYREVVPDASCDAVVLALTLPNDLSAWDANSETLLRSRPSAYSFAGFVFGRELAVRWWTDQNLSNHMTDATRTFLARQWERLREDRAGRGDEPLFVFPYSLAGEVQSLPPIDGVVVLDSPVKVEAEYIPNDGHPNGLGNTRFGELLAEAIAADPRTGPVFDPMRSEGAGQNP